MAVINPTLINIKDEGVSKGRVIELDFIGAGVLASVSGLAGTIDIPGGGGSGITELTGNVTAGPGSGSQVATIANDAVTFAKMQNINTDRLLGRDTTAVGDTEEITVGGGLEFTGGPGIQRSALTGDVTATAGNNSTIIANDAVTTVKILNSNVTDAKLASDSVITSKILNSNVTYAKIQNISATSRSLGRKTAGAGVVEELTLTELLDFIGSATHGDVLYRGASSWARLAAGTSGQFLKTQGSGVDPVWATVSGTPAAWEGNIIGCWGNGNPGVVLSQILNSSLAPTPTNISTSIARISYFRLATAITVANIRWFGVGATTAIYHIAIYRASDNVRMSVDHNPNTTAAWNSVASVFTLAAGILYYCAVAVDSTGTTQGIAAMSGTTSAVQSGIQVVPTSWPGSLDINAATPLIDPYAFAQAAVTAGVLPDPGNAPVAMAAAWTGGMPAIFLDIV